MIEEYKQLTSEIDRFSEFLEYLSIKQIGLDNQEYAIINCNILEHDEFDSLFKSLKSNLVIMLYNLVEATVRVSMNNYYDNFNNKENNYFLSAEKIKKIWIKYSSQSFKENFIQQQVFEMIETAINNEIAISLDFSKFHLSGNADVSEIKEILKEHGIEYEESVFKVFGGSLKSVKDMRNSLAHGNISFEDNGKNLTINDVLRYKEQTYQCLEYFMQIVENFIDNAKDTKLRKNTYPIKRIHKKNRRKTFKSMNWRKRL
ncbi:MAE_28990/MAE_18760 family HEPN-like nuclease [Lactococcus lactis]|uniref:MAE_28990/MAE_18760 family HEPN-like nuclease n=1 Tax=Lactococcus lactis TaxID=1358 RepID=UPI003D151BE3